MTFLGELLYEHLEALPPHEALEALYDIQMDDTGVLAMDIEKAQERTSKRLLNEGKCPECVAELTVKQTTLYGEIIDSEKFCPCCGWRDEG